MKKPGDAPGLKSRESFQTFNVLKVLLSSDGALMANEVFLRDDSHCYAFHFDHISGLVSLFELYTLYRREDFTVQAEVFKGRLLVGRFEIGNVIYRDARYLKNRSRQVLSFARRVHNQVEVVHAALNTVKPDSMSADDDETDFISLKFSEQAEVAFWNS